MIPFVFSVFSNTDKQNTVAIIRANVQPRAVHNQQQQAFHLHLEAGENLRLALLTQHSTEKPTIAAFTLLNVPSHAVVVVVEVVRARMITPNAIKWFKLMVTKFTVHITHNGAQVHANCPVAMRLLSHRVHRKLILFDIQISNS